MAVTLDPSRPTVLADDTAPVRRNQTQALADDPVKRAAYVEEANEKYEAAVDAWEQDPEEGLQTMKEQVKKWQTVLRSEDWDTKDENFKRELTTLVAKGLDFIQSKQEIPTLADVQADPASASKYLKIKKKELEAIEKNWPTDPDFYGQQLVAHYASMAPLLEPATFMKLDPKVGEDVLEHMDDVSALAQTMLAEAGTLNPDGTPKA